MRRYVCSTHDGYLLILPESTTNMLKRRFGAMLLQHEAYLSENADASDQESILEDTVLYTDLGLIDVQCILRIGK